MKSQSVALGIYSPQTVHELLPSTGCAWLQKQCNQRPPVRASQSVQGKGLGWCELLGMTYTYHAVTYLVILNQIVSRNFARQNLGWKVWVWGTILVYYLLVASFPGPVPASSFWSLAFYISNQKPDYGEGKRLIFLDAFSFAIDCQILWLYVTNFCACSYWSIGSQWLNSNLWVKAGYLWGADRGAGVQASQEHRGWPDPWPGAGWPGSFPVLSGDNLNMDQNSVDIHYTILTTFFVFVCLVFSNNMQCHLCPTKWNTLHSTSGCGWGFHRVHTSPASSLQSYLTTTVLSLAGVVWWFDSLTSLTQLTCFAWQTGRWGWYWKWSVLGLVGSGLWNWELDYSP